MVTLNKLGSADLRVMFRLTKLEANRLNSSDRTNIVEIPISISQTIE